MPKTYIEPSELFAFESGGRTLISFEGKTRDGEHVDVMLTPTEGQLEQLRTKLDVATGIRVVDCCWYCGKPNHASRAQRVRIDGDVYLCHDSCFVAEKKKRTRPSRLKLFFGWLGDFLLHI